MEMSHRFRLTSLHTGAMLSIDSYKRMVLKGGLFTSTRIWPATINHPAGYGVVTSSTDRRFRLGRFPRPTRYGIVTSSTDRRFRLAIFQAHKLMSAQSLLCFMCTVFCWLFSSPALGASLFAEPLPCCAARSRFRSRFRSQFRVRWYLLRPLIAWLARVAWSAADFCFMCHYGLTSSLWRLVMSADIQSTCWECWPIKYGLIIP